MITPEHVVHLVEELEALATERSAQGWDAFWRDCMRFALPQDVSYEALLMQGSISHVTSAVQQAATAKRTRHLYDQTSLWAVERLTAGLLSLKTPESTQWHGLDIDDPFGYEAGLQEESWFDRLSRYLFKVRANPRSGFWPSHKSALRSVTALGSGFIFLEELFGDSSRLPWRYEFVPLGECFAAVDMSGQLLRFFRRRSLTAEQIAKRWPDTVSAKIREYANDPDRKNRTFAVAHCLGQRDDLSRARGVGVRAAPIFGAYILLEDKHLLGETGYYEMPYIGHHWNHIAGRAFSEGPMALALAEIKSLNEMSRNELISSQQAVRPPLAVHGENFTKINLNAGSVNKGLISGDGRLLAQPIMTHTRPDFAQQVLENRRNSVRELLYLNLWQILIQNPDMTATEALLRSQEKGDLLGPVGISFNHSLSLIVDREIAILGRKGAFEPGAPLEAPDEVVDKDIMPFFTAPLDRMRNLEEVLGAQRTVAGMLEVAAFNPKIMDRLNIDRYADLLRKGNGAPADLFYSDEEVSDSRDQQEQMEQLAQTLEMVQQGGAAAGAIGTGMNSLNSAAGGMGGAAGMPQPPAAGPDANVARAVAA